MPPNLQAVIRSITLCLLLLTPLMLYTLHKGNTHNRGFFQDPDDYTQIAIALESWENHTWWNKTTETDGQTQRPDHWSQIHRAWLVLGASIHHFITGEPKKDSLLFWGFWSNAPLLLLGTALLTTCLYLPTQKLWTAPLCANFLFWMPTTRWAGNLGHPDHHLWIITAAACAGACLLQNKPKLAGLSLGFLHALSPLTFLPFMLGVCLGIWLKTSKESKTLLSWSAITALTLWILEYWANPQFSRWDAPSPWIPLLLLLTAHANCMHPQSPKQWIIAILATLGTSTLVFLSLLNPTKHFTPLCPQWQEFAKQEGIYGPTPWWDPIYFITILPAILALTIPSWRKIALTKIPALSASLTTTIAASLKIRAHEGTSAILPLWIILAKEKSIPKITIPSLLVFCTIATSLQYPHSQKDLLTLCLSLPENSRTLSSPIYHPAIAWLSKSSTPLSHHWEAWPQNLPVYQILTEPNPSKFLEKAKNMGITHLIFGYPINGTPDNPTLLQLTKGNPIPGTSKILSQGNLHLYQINP